jgi:hypothetical protein
MLTILLSPRSAAPMNIPDAVLIGLGVAGLAIHCGDMFSPHRSGPFPVATYWPA